MSQTNWDKRHYEQALFYSTWSKDPSTQVGAVIVDYDHRLLGEGYNGFPRGVHDHPDRYTDKVTKYAMIVHAEANAILNAGRNGCKVVGMSLYTTKFPCSECTKLIIQSGISKIFTPRLLQDGSTWAKNAEWSRLMLQEATVWVKEFEIND